MITQYNQFIKESIQKNGFIASVDEDRIEDIKIIAKKLEDLGCKIDNILEFSGIISGSISSNISIDDLKKIDGIKEVEPDREIETIDELKSQANKYNI